MTRYSREADKLNEAMDLGEFQAFKLDEGKGPVSYPRNWPRQDMVDRLGFTAYDPPPPEPHIPTPEDMPLTRLQLRKALLIFFGITAAQIDELIMQIVDPVQRELAAMTWQDAQTYNIGHPLIAQIAGAIGLDDAEIRKRWVQAASEEWS